MRPLSSKDDSGWNLVETVGGIQEWTAEILGKNYRKISGQTFERIPER